MDRSLQEDTQPEGRKERSCLAILVIEKRGVIVKVNVLRSVREANVDCYRGYRINCLVGQFARVEFVKKNGDVFRCEILIQQAHRNEANE